MDYSGFIVICTLNSITDICTKIRTDDIFMIYFVEDMYVVQNLVNGIPDFVSVYLYSFIQRNKEYSYSLMQ